MATIFLDESGFTGQDLLNPEQPVFTIATLNYSEVACQQLKTHFFSNVRSVELKHSVLKKLSRQQRMILAFLDELSRSSGSVKISLVHKRYALTAKLVDLIVEPAALEDGFNLYENDGASAFANLLYYILPTIGGKDFYDSLHFALEQNLMEILQVIYRGRGGDFDLDEKTLTFYLADQLLYLDPTDRELALKEQLLHALNVLLILKTAILTRIAGSGQLGLRHFRMIPIGGKSIYAAGETFTKRLSDLLDELQKTSYPSWANKKMLNFISSNLYALLAQSHIRLTRTNETQSLYRQTPRSHLEYLDTFALDFTHAAERGFDHLLTLPLLESAYLVGGLLVVPISGKSMRELYRSSLSEIMKRPRPADLPDLLACMEIISKDDTYPGSLRSALGDAILLLRELQKLEPNRAAYYEQESNQTDLYYAFPLSTFPAFQTLQEYFETEASAEEQTEVSFRELLRRTITTSYPADGFLPIGKNYKTFPFVLFRSFQLGETRQKIFTEKYLFSSQELNIINMLLSGKEL